MQWTPRTTVAAVVQRADRFLLVEEDTGDGLVLNQPAGHLEDGESLLQAVIRETLEETACEFRPAGLVGIYRWRMPDSGRTYMRYCFHGELLKEHPGRPLDEGIARALWLTEAEIRAQAHRLRSPMVMRCLDDYLDGQRHSLGLLNDVE